jgi:hypothetical protein
VETRYAITVEEMENYRVARLPKTGRKGPKT